MPTPRKPGARRVSAPRYFLVTVTTLNGPEIRAYKARSVGDIENKVRTSSALSALHIREVTVEAYQRHKRP